MTTDPITHRTDYAELETLVGAELGPSPWREVTQDQVNTFADATDDHQWIHTDPERALTGPFGGPIAHGYLTLSLLIPMSEEVLQVSGVSTKVNYGLEKVRFPAPVPVGSRVRLRTTVRAVDPVPGGYQLTLDNVVELEGGTKPAVAATVLFRFYA